MVIVSVWLPLKNYKSSLLTDNSFLFWRFSADIATKPFYFMMANYFYKTHEGVYSPAEIAVCSFNFREGVTKLYHTFINPGNKKFIFA